MVRSFGLVFASTYDVWVKAQNMGTLSKYAEGSDGHDNIYLEVVKY